MLHLPEFLAPTCTTCTGSAILARLNTIHNLHYYLQLMREMREAIEQHRFDAFRLQFAAADAQRAEPERRSAASLPVRAGRLSAPGWSNAWVRRVRDALRRAPTHKPRAPQATPERS